MSSADTSSHIVSHTIAAEVHGRYLVDLPAGPGPFAMVVGFHGYAERAEHMMDALRRIRAQRPWLLVSIQALNRFYRRDNEVVANWMTREDRDLAIADNIRYVAHAVAAVRRRHPTNGTIVYAGFSQGVAMAYRAAAFATTASADLAAPAGAIMLAGDVPPDVAPHLAKLPPLLIGRGVSDDWYTDAKADADQRLFAAAGITPRLEVFDGGHEWADAFVAAAREFADTLTIP